MRVDSDLLKTIAMEAAVLVENASLASAEESARRYREELGIAASIQQGLMAVRIPELSYARVLAHSVPCKEIGGDFYDVIATDSAFYVVVADISGKGVSAALLASTLQGLVHAQVLAGVSLPQIAMFSNKYICEKSISKYATLILLKLSPDGAVEYLNCGHVAPLRHRADQIHDADKRKSSGRLNARCRLHFRDDSCRAWRAGDCVTPTASPKRKIRQENFSAMRGLNLLCGRVAAFRIFSSRCSVLWIPLPPPTIALCSRSATGDVSDGALCQIANSPQPLRNISRVGMRERIMMESSSGKT